MRRRSAAREKARAAFVAKRGASKRIAASYDAAQTHGGNQRWWSAADSLSPRATNTSAVRSKLVQRSRYETANNCWAAGMARTLCDQVIGTGPRLQLTGIGRYSSDVEGKFAEWMEVVDLADKLRIDKMACLCDGECFIQQTNNPPAVKDHPVTLWPRLYETDQISTPNPSIVSEDDAVDGIVFDEHGNPATYHRLKSHPGGIGQWSASYDKVDVPADLMIHDFLAERPGQARGVPEITAALPLFALMRDYTLATLDAAKAAAYFTAVLQSNTPASALSAGDVESIDAVAALESMYLNRNMVTTMPEGWNIKQVTAEHPTSTHGEFHKQLLNEIARCLCMPFNIAAGNSSGYNYASGRLDHQTWWRAVYVRRQRTERIVLNRLFDSWLREAILIEGYLPQPLRNIGVDWSRHWQWDGFGHVDPAKEATGQAKRLASGTTTLQIETGREGLDWEEVQDQRIREELREQKRRTELAKEMGVKIKESEHAEKTQG